MCSQPQQAAVSGRLLKLTRAQLAGRHRRAHAQRAGRAKGRATDDQALHDRADADADCDARAEEEGALHASGATRAERGVLAQFSL